MQSQLAGLYTRLRGPTESTEFSLTRFLVPALSGYRGWSVFMDCDMLCRTDIAALAEGYGARVLTFSRSSTGTDVGKRADVVTAAARVLEETGQVDYVVNTAGVLPRGELSETTEETIYAATEINYLGPVFIAQEFYPHLARTKGSMLLFTSSSYTRGRSGYSLYSSAKAAIVNLTQALADEWAGFGVRVNW